MSQIRIAMVAMALLLAAGNGCRKDGENRSVARTEPAPASLAELAHEVGVTFPPSARLIGFSREAGIDDHLKFKVELDSRELSSFLASSPIPADAMEPGERGLLGPDGGYWDPRRAPRLRTGQKLLPNARVLNIGIGEHDAKDEGGATMIALYIVNHGT